VINHGKLGNISQIISAIAAVVAILFSYSTVKISWKNAEEDKQAKRPYFVLGDPGIKEQKLGALFAINIDVKNIGIHTATNFAYEIIFFEDLPTEGLKIKEKHDDEIVGDLPPSFPVYIQKDIGDVRIPGIPTKYILMLIKYKDAISKDLYSQKLYMKWHGNPESKGYVIYNFERLSASEANKIEESFGTIINEFLDPKHSIITH